MGISVFAAGALLFVASFGACAFYLLVPYEVGAHTQTWTATVTSGPRSASYSGFATGRCGDEGSAGQRGASAAKQAAFEQACFAASLCAGDSVCDCAPRGQVAYRCEELQLPGRNRLDDLVSVPVR